MQKKREAGLSKFKLFETDQFLSDVESLPEKIR